MDFFQYDNEKGRLTGHLVKEDNLGWLTLYGFELYRAHIYWVKEISLPYFELIDSIPKAQCCQVLELYNQKEK